MEVNLNEQHPERVVNYTGRGGNTSLTTLDHEHIEIIKVPRLKEENIISDQVFNVENRYNDMSLTSPTLVNTQDGCTCCDPFDQIPTTSTGQKRGRPVKDVTKWRPVKKAFIKKEWTDEEISLLIDLWRNEEALYNTKSELHANKEERTKAVERIMCELQKNNIAVCTEQVSEKMTSLRCYYSGQIGKERASKTNGADSASVFVSPWKFMKNMSFLQSNYKPRNTDLSTKHTPNGGSSIHNSTNKIHNTTNNVHNNSNNKHNSRNNIHDSTNLHNGTNNIHNGGNIHNGTNNSHNGANNSHNGRNNIHDGANNTNNGVNNIHSVNSVHSGVNSIHSGMNNIHGGTSNIHNGANDVHNLANSIHNGVNNIHNSANNIRKDKENQRNMMLNALKQTGKIMEVALERFSKETSKTSDESFGDLVVSLLKEIKSPEKKDMVKLEIHNLLVKAKYET